MIKIEGKKHDLGGGMIIYRILPDKKKRMVGPFCFLDHMGPIIIKVNQNTDVRPHPHIGLSTLTYLFDGNLVHRDSVGSVATISPGEVNWMTAGSGISHSERSPDQDRTISRPFHGLQFWVALPDGQEDISPSFFHYTKDQIPVEENEQRKMTLIVGEIFDLKSPVKTYSPMILAMIDAKKKFSFEFNFFSFEIAIYVVNGVVKYKEQEITEREMMVIDENELAKIEVNKGTKFAIIGGEKFMNSRHIWWNLVSSSKDKIEQAKKQWKEGSFPMVPGEKEFIPLPEYK
ncbi:MAG: pirin family protein [Bdellovibrionaceae bacterium]|nr:pirin family protein [Pseudobdellovibrionaceae bacterium]NUM57511.1 pirin family protein [Pseudobdellovibrionaceae bacterium]